jgi:plastocyanin
MGTGGASGEITVVVAGGPSPCVGPPGTPTGLSSSVNGTSVTVNWNSAATGCAATGYVIEAGSSTGLANLANFNTGSTSRSFSATGVAAGTYFVRVRAANGSGTSAASNEITVTVSTTPGPCTSPGAPGNFAASVSGTTVALTWGAGSGSPTSYVVEVGTSAGSSNISSSDTGNTQTSLSATLAPGTYFARVKGKNACGTSTASNEVTFTISAPPCPLPSAPTGLTATVNGSSIVLSWNAAGGTPTSYVVEIGTSSGASNVASTDTGNTTTSATTGTLASGTYFIRVRAKNACGTGDASNQVSATIPAATQGVITITSSGVSPRSLTVSVGTQVTFVNNDSQSHNMASDPHPEHTDCTELNQVGFLAAGQSRQTGNLNTAKTCGYHDHDNAFNSAFRGTITISN